MRILGIDPGYAIVGFGVVSYHGAEFVPLEYGAITTEAGTRFAARLDTIYDDLDFVQPVPAGLGAIERLSLTLTKKLPLTWHRHVASLCCVRKSMAFPCSNTRPYR